MGFESKRELKRLAGFGFNTEKMSEEEFRGFVLAYLLNLAQSVADIEEKLENSLR